MALERLRTVGRIRRKRRIRRKMRPERGLPRLCVFRSNRHIYAQLIDDGAGKVLTTASTLNEELAGKLGGHSNVAAAKEVGTAIAKQAKAMKIDKVCFDRNGYRYHGKVKAVAEAARAGGLHF